MSKFNVNDRVIIKRTGKAGSIRYRLAVGVKPDEEVYAVIVDLEAGYKYVSADGLEKELDKQADV